MLQWINNQVVKAKPEFHKKTFLKPFHKDGAFCSTCHKVGIPMAVNHYKEFLRGQNHNDPYLLSGVSGHGARSFYYPPVAQDELRRVPHAAEAEPRLRQPRLRRPGERKVHNHLFPAANTGLPKLLEYDGWQGVADIHADFLKDKKVRVDIFGVKEGGTIDGKLDRAFARNCPSWKRGKTYLVEVVVRTLGMGHLFTQGTVDSNEIWVDFEARSGERVIGRTGGMANPDDPAPSIPGRILSTFSCSIATATGSIAAIRRTSSRRSTTSRSRPAPRRWCTTSSTSLPTPRQR